MNGPKRTAALLNVRRRMRSESARAQMDKWNEGNTGAEIRKTAQKVGAASGPRLREGRSMWGPREVGGGRRARVLKWVAEALKLGAPRRR